MAKQKGILERLPRERKKVFDYELEWQSLTDEGVIDRVVKPWVAKKVKEYLGVEEPSLINLVIGLLTRGNCTPQLLLGKVGNILDEVADQFVMKLWQVLIFEQLKIKEGIYAMQKQVEKE